MGLCCVVICLAWSLSSPCIIEMWFDQPEDLWLLVGALLAQVKENDGFFAWIIHSGINNRAVPFVIGCEHSQYLRGKLLFNARNNHGYAPPLFMNAVARISDSHTKQGNRPTESCCQRFGNQVG